MLKLPLYPGVMDPVWLPLAPKMFAFPVMFFVLLCGWCGGFVVDQ
jgi:hypothetical protein